MFQITSSSLFSSLGQAQEQALGPPLEQALGPPLEQALGPPLEQALGPPLDVLCPYWCACYPEGKMEDQIKAKHFFKN